MTTEPMCRSVSSFTAAARSAVGSIVTTLPPLAARIVLTFISSLLGSWLRKRPAIPCMDNDPPRGWFRQDVVQCEKTAPLMGINFIPLPVTLARVLTVSYTHLRAHETDSYLVCRLLLA